MSAVQCSPGFRALTYVLSFPHWKKKSLAHKERWGITLPPEIFAMLLKNVSPKDIVSFCQASFTVERWYCSSTPQFDDLKLRGFESSIPHGLGVDGVCCRLCHTWRHSKCIGLYHTSLDHRYLCSNCEESKHCSTLDPGGINKTTRRAKGTACHVNVSGHPKTLQLRLSRPSHLRPERRLLGNHVSTPPLLIDYTVRFGNVFSGLVYGLKEDLG